jgi:hypothetical protein
MENPQSGSLGVVMRARFAWKMWVGSQALEICLLLNFPVAVGSCIVPGSLRYNSLDGFAVLSFFVGFCLGIAFDLDSSRLGSSRPNSGRCSSIVLRFLCSLANFRRYSRRVALLFFGVGKFSWPAHQLTLV